MGQLKKKLLVLALIAALVFSMGAGASAAQLPADEIELQEETGAVLDNADAEVIPLDADEILPDAEVIPLSDETEETAANAEVPSVIFAGRI